NGDPLDSWRQFAEQREGFPAQLRASVRHPGEVPTWSRETSDEPGRDGIQGGSHDDGNGPRRTFGGSGCWGTPRHNHVHFEGDRFGRELSQPLAATSRIPRFDANVLALNVAEFAQAFPECLDTDLGVGTGNRDQHTDPWGRLSFGCEQHGEQQKGDADGHSGDFRSHVSTERINSPPNAGISRGRRPSAACRSYSDSICRRRGHHYPSRTSETPEGAGKPHGVENTL